VRLAKRSAARAAILGESSANGSCRIESQQLNIRARKGASFSLRSKENSGYPKVCRELLRRADLCLTVPALFFIIENH
jgi:hypothetical protein